MPTLRPPGPQRPGFGVGSLSLGLGALDGFAFKGSELTQDHRDRDPRPRRPASSRSGQAPGGRITSRATPTSSAKAGQPRPRSQARRGRRSGTRPRGRPRSVMDITAPGRARRSSRPRSASCATAAWRSGSREVPVEPARPAPPILDPTTVVKPPIDPSPPGPTFPTKTPSPPTAAPQQQPGQTDPGSALPQTKGASPGDLAKAVAATPQGKKLIEAAETQGKKDLGKLSTGGKVLLGSVVGADAAAVVAALAAHPGERADVLKFVNGKEIPVPYTGVSSLPHQARRNRRRRSFDIIKIFGGGRSDRRRPALRAAPGRLPRAGRRQGDAAARRCCAIVDEQVDVVERGRRAALERPVHRDLPPLGDPVHRRSRLQRSALRAHRRRIAGPTALALPTSARLARRAGPRRRREDDLLPPPQGHAADARGARARRHRLGGARGRVLRAARLDAASRAHPPAGAAGSTCARSSATSASTAPFDDGEPHASTCAPIAQDEGWHHIPNIGFFLWRLGSLSAARTSRPGRRARAWQLPLQPARERRAALHALAPRGRRGRARRRSCTCPGRSAARSSRTTSTGTARPPPPDFTDLYGAIDDGAAAGVEPRRQRSS